MTARVALDLPAADDCCSICSAKLMAWADWWVTATIPTIRHRVTMKKFIADEDNELDSGAADEFDILLASCLYVVFFCVWELLLGACEMIRERVLMFLLQVENYK